jgi:branched-chain amino acid aminotransferase
VLSYIDGKIIETAKASLSIHDLGVMRGYGVFDRLRTYEKRPFHLDAHLARLSFSAKEIGLALPKPIEEIKALALGLVERAPAEECDIRILATGGVCLDGLLAEKPTLAILLSPLASKPALPLKTATSFLARSFPQCKTTHYLPAIVALQKERKNGVQEILYCNAKREILEGSTSNFFAFCQGRLVTSPGPDILFGITREIVLNLAAPHFAIECRNLHLDELPLIEEAFITSSVREIAQVAAIDGFALPAPTPKTAFLKELFAAYTRQGSWPKLNKLVYFPIKERLAYNGFCQP